MNLSVIILSSVVQNSLKEYGGLTERSNTNSSHDFISLWRIRASRLYKLTADAKLNGFEDYLNSELKLENDLYVLDASQHDCASAEKLKSDKNRGPDIMANRIDASYFSWVISVSEPNALFDNLIELKRLETRVTILSARKEWYSMKYRSTNESAAAKRINRIHFSTQ